MVTFADTSTSFAQIAHHARGQSRRPVKSSNNQTAYRHSCSVACDSRLTCVRLVSSSRDPVGYTGGINLVAICDQNPVARVDPLGFSWSINDFFNHYWYGHGAAVDIGKVGLLIEYRQYHSAPIGAAINRALTAGIAAMHCNDGPGAYSAAGKLPKLTETWDSTYSLSAISVLGRTRVNQNGAFIVTWVCENCCASGGGVKITSYDVTATVDFDFTDAFSNPYFTWQTDNAGQVKKRADCINKCYKNFFDGKINHTQYIDCRRKCEKDFPTSDDTGDAYIMFAKWTDNGTANGVSKCN